MIALKMLLTVAGVLLLAAALGIPLYGLWIRIRTARRKAGGETELMETEKTEPKEIAWRGSVALALVACLPLLVAASIVVVPSGMGGVRVSQIRGTIAGNALSGRAFRDAAGGKRGDLRPARSPFHCGLCWRKAGRREHRGTGSACSRARG